MSPELLIPAHDEKDYCHFCFGATNVLLVFPHVRPDLQSFIDNVIGIELTTKAQETFSLCEECIGTMDMFTTFRSKCRSHYNKVREMKIMNQAVKNMFPMLHQQQRHISMNLASPCSATTVNGLNASSINQEVLYPEVRLVEATSSATSNGTEPANGSYAESTCKRIYSKLSPEIGGADSSTKKARTQNEANRGIKYHHIRELMKRFRNNRMQNNNTPLKASSQPPANIMPKRIEFTDKDSLANESNTSVPNSPHCKPCVVVIQKVPAHQIVVDSCKI